MKDPDYPSLQPKTPVEEALIDRNADPDAIAGPAPVKKQGDSPPDAVDKRPERKPAP